MAGPLQRWRRARRTGHLLADIERLLQAAEQAQGSPDATQSAATALARLEAARREAGTADAAQIDLLEARALFLDGRAAEARPAARRAATARPYDVEGRLTHGLICLALDRLEEAGHEFASVLEEFAGDPDAEAGRRAVSLAHGRTPISEHALPDDLDEAAALLVRCWRAASVADQRLAALRAAGAEAPVLAAIERVMSGG